jgi:hypothetical protein
MLYSSIRKAGQKNRGTLERTAWRLLNVAMSEVGWRSRLRSSLRDIEKLLTGIGVIT